MSTIEQIDDFHVGDIVRNRNTGGKLVVRSGDGAAWLSRFYELVACPHDEIDQAAADLSSGITDEMIEKAARELYGGDAADRPGYLRQARRILSAALAGRTVVHLPDLADDAVDDHGWGTANATVSSRDGRPRVHVDADDGDSDACLSWPAEVAERAGLALVATARRAQQMVAEDATRSGVGEPAKRNCYCGGPEEIYPHEYGTGRHCRSGVGGTQ